MKLEPNIRRIIVTGDVLRPTPEQQVSAQRSNIHWLGHLLNKPLQSATGLSVEIASWGEDPGGEFNDAMIREIFSAFGVPFTLEGWAAIYDSTVPNEVLDAVVSNTFSDALVIGFEIPPVLERALQRAGVPLIVTAIHPLRYMDDIFLGFRSPNSKLQDALRLHAITDEKFWFMAGLQCAAVTKKSFFSPEPDSLILVGQMPNDASCIVDGRFASLQNFRSAIVGAAAEHRKVYYKKHPLAHADEMIARLREWGVDADETDENIYYLLAHPNVNGVLTLSSSVGIEARYFGKKASFLLKGTELLWATGDLSKTNCFVGIDDRWLTPDFWRDVLRESLSVSASDGLRVATKPNRLRLSLGSFWGYNWADSDILVDLAMAPGSALNRRIRENSDRNAENLSDLSASIEQVTQAIEELDLGLRTKVDISSGQVDSLAQRLQVCAQRLADMEAYLARPLIVRVFFRRNGRPVRILRRILFHSSGKPRGVFRRWIIRPDGQPHRALRQWMTAPEYQRLPRAYQPSTSGKLRTQEAWRSVLDKSKLDDAELDALMDRIRDELHDDATE